MKTTLALALLLSPLFARADWPTYLHDISRVGHTEESLKFPLTLRSTFASPTAPQLAWAGEDGKLASLRDAGFIFTCNRWYRSAQPLA